jgi:hypothetical protein
MQTIFEERLEGGTRWLVKNARPLGMRIAVAVVAAIAVGVIGVTAFAEIREGRWGMGLIRGLFLIVVATAARFTLFGEEALQVAGGELLWTRGTNFERRCKLEEIERLERTGNQLRVHVRGAATPIVVGSGLRQPEPAMVWLTARVEAALRAK